MLWDGFKKLQRDDFAWYPTIQSDEEQWSWRRTNVMPKVKACESFELKCKTVTLLMTFWQYLIKNGDPKRGGRVGLNVSDKTRWPEYNV